MCRFSSSSTLYRVKSIVAQPFTGHVETVVLLSKVDISTKRIKVDFPLEDLDTSGFQEGATYGEIKDWIKQKYHFQVSSLNIAQVKEKHGIIERENFNKPKEPDSKQPGCSEHKAKAIEDALKHFHMI